jgi:hypothetical protein
MLSMLRSRAAGVNKIVRRFVYLEFLTTDGADDTDKEFHRSLP